MLEHVLKGERVTLAALEEWHVPPLRALFSLPEVAEAWPGDNLRRLDDRLEEDDALGMVVELDGQVIGFIQYSQELDPNYRYAMIDIVLHPDWCNRGFGTDALRTLARHLFEDLGHHRIMIDPRATNTRAITSYRKVGFRDIGIMRQYELGNDGQWHDALLMDLLRDELT
jgi:aminoglycoside 6'-N-acetyltransferase